MGITSAKKWLFKKLMKAALAGCQPVELENKEARIAICKKCPYFGTVKPINGLKLPGCTICGCPIDTKAALRTVPRLYEGEPLTITEVLEMQKQKVFQPDKIEMEEVICPHPEGNRWSEIDSYFKLINR
jgi:hypothetical protein